MIKAQTTTTVHDDAQANTLKAANLKKVQMYQLLLGSGNVRPASQLLKIAIVASGGMPRTAASMRTLFMADVVTSATRACFALEHIDEMPTLFASLLVHEPIVRQQEPEAIKAVTSAWAHLCPDRAAALGLSNVGTSIPRLSDTNGNSFVLTADPEYAVQCDALAARLLGTRVILIAEKRAFLPDTRSRIMDLALRLREGLTAEEIEVARPSLILYRNMAEQLSAFGQALTTSDWFGTDLVSGIEALRSHPQVAQLMGALPNTVAAVSGVAAGARAEAAGSNAGTRTQSQTHSGEASGAGPIPEAL